jgi:hypothetical protein
VIDELAQPGAEVTSRASADPALEELRTARARASLARRSAALKRAAQSARLAVDGRNRDVPGRAPARDPEWARTALLSEGKYLRAAYSSYVVAIV